MSKSTTPGLDQSNESSLTVTALTKWVLSFADLLDENTEVLTRLDSAIGDADHGINMERGAHALRVALADTVSDSPSALFHAVGDSLLEGVGGAAGPLYASFFFGVSRASVGHSTLDPHQLASALEGGVNELVARGRAEIGDKTMVDAASPAVNEMRAAAAAGRSMDQVRLVGQQAANAGRSATEALQALKGRASYLGPRSVGHIDPGAASMAYLFDALAGLNEFTAFDEVDRAT